MKFKKFLAILMSVAMLMTTLLSTTAFATEETEPETKIYFEAPDAWGEVKNIYCHLYTIYGGKEIKSYAWGAKGTKCELVDAEKKLYSYDTSKLCLADDTSGVAIIDGADYALCFHGFDTNSKCYETVNLTFGSDCLGDTAYVTGEIYRGPSDTVYEYIGAWKNNSDKYGHRAYIYSYGEIEEGSYFPVYKPIEETVCEWLHNWAVNNSMIITPEVVFNILNKTGANAQAVYDKYAQMYADELADIENYPKTANLEKIKELLGLEILPDFSDVNGDNEINISDATAIMKFAIGLIGEIDFLSDFADINNDGVVNVVDATMLQKFIVGLTQ